MKNKEMFCERPKLWTLGRETRLIRIINVNAMRGSRARTGIATPCRCRNISVLCLRKGESPSASESRGVELMRNRRAYEQKENEQQGFTHNAEESVIAMDLLYHSARFGLRRLVTRNDRE